MRIEKYIKGSAQDVALSHERKEALKRRFFAALPAHEAQYFGFSRFVRAIRTVALDARPAQYFRTLLHEKLLTLVEFRSRRRGFFNVFSGFAPRKILAGVTALALVFTVVFGFAFNVQRAEAFAITVLEEVSGRVTVFRDTKPITGTAGFRLKADDIIRTGTGSRAVIRFLDQSVSRLDENTEVKISRLFVNPSNKTETIVELVLNSGRLWSRVINLIDNVSRFQVKAHNTVAVAKKKAAFDVSVVSKNKAKVSSVQNKVDLVVATQKQVVATTLVKGFTAEVTANTAASPVIEENSVAAQSQENWVKENLAQDRKYIQTVKIEAEAQVNAQAKESNGAAISAVKFAFTFDGFEKQKKLISQAASNFAEAEVMFVKGDRVAAAKFLADARQKIKSATAWANNNEAQYADKAAEMRRIIAGVLGAYEKQLSLVLPNDPLYDFKSAISQTKVEIAASPLEKTQEQLDQAGDKLLEAHELFEQGDSASAAVQLEAYSKEVSAVVYEVSALPADEKEKAVSALLENKFEDLKQLESISPGVSGESTTVTVLSTVTGETVLTSQALVSPDSADQAVSQAKTETLTSIGKAVSAVQGSAPGPEVLQKIQNIQEVGVNGKQIVDINISNGAVTVKSQPYRTVNSKIPAAPRARP